MRRFFQRLSHCHAWRIDSQRIQTPSQNPMCGIMFSHTTRGRMRYVRTRFSNFGLCFICEEIPKYKMILNLHGSMPQQAVEAGSSDPPKQQVYYIDACQNCKSTDNLEEHHIVPEENGGLDIPTNRVYLCERCHSAVHYDQTAPTVEQKNRNLGEFGVTPNDGTLSQIDRPIHTSQKRIQDF